MVLASVTLMIGARPDNVRAADLIPPLARIKTDRPRVLLRPKPSRYAIALSDLQAIPRDESFRQMLAQLRGRRSPSAQAMVWLLTGEKAAADKAIAAMQAYRFREGVDTFHVYFTLSQFGLAYDWLYDYEGFTRQIKAEVRANVMPLAEHGLAVTNDHMFHNYIWMSAGGVALWALATAGEDERADQLFEKIRQRFNSGLFPAWKYLDGLPSEPMGYWALYVLSPGVLAILGAQSAFESDLVGTIHNSDGDWLNRHFENLIHSTLPDMRYIPWGDLQSGPNGGVTYEMAGIMDALTWATKSSQGTYFSERLAKKRGLARFHGDTAIFYMLYTTQLRPAPAQPQLSFLAGNDQSGHFIARSSWNDDATIVAFRATDHFGDHHHYDQGSFTIYRNGLLAVDPPVYRQVRGPQQKTEVHNTLLLGGQPQRPVRGQWFKTVEEFQKNLIGGRQLETGDILFHTDAGAWAAVAGQFAQAYSADLIQSCVRQLLFVRPGIIVVVDQLVPPSGRSLPEVQWLLQVPKPPVVEGPCVWTSNGKSWLRCRALSPGGSVPAVEPTPVNTHRVSFRYTPTGPLRAVHVLETGDGPQPEKATEAAVRLSDKAIEATLDGTTFIFSTRSPYAVTMQGKNPSAR
jgi:hypothetical protein